MLTNPNPKYNSVELGDQLETYIQLSTLLRESFIDKIVIRCKDMPEANPLNQMGLGRDG